MKNDFLTAVQSVLDVREAATPNVSYTENGAKGLKTTNSKLLDLNFALASFRNKSDLEITAAFEKAFLENKSLAIVWLFWSRDVRGGAGERRFFRICLRQLANTEPELVKKILPLISEYGRWDDLWVLLETPVMEDVITLVKEQFVQDINNMKKGSSISLLSKWLPRESASSEDTRRKAALLTKNFDISPAKYRKIVSQLTAYLKVVETKMSAKDWTSIDYEAVPSRANLIYNDAFLKNDTDRRKIFLESLKKGEAKINAGTLFPHDIVHKYTKGRQNVVAYSDSAIEAMWKALPNVGVPGDTIVVADTSGSMTAKVGKTETSCLDVSAALAFYFAERLCGPFKDRFIVFSSQPKLLDMSATKTLHQKLRHFMKINDCSNTNIEAVFDLLLQTAILHKTSAAEMPKNVLIISDMEFDAARFGCIKVTRDSFSRIVKFEDSSLFEAIAAKWAQHGYKLPRLVFWNVGSRSGTIPMKENEQGVVLVSGFSPNTAKMLMSGKTDPYEAMVDTLKGERYAPVWEAVKPIRGRCASICLIDEW